MRARDVASGSVAIVAIATSIFAIGGAPRWGQAVVAGLIVIALIPLLASRRSAQGNSPLVVLIVIAGGLTALSLIPLPSGLISALNPTGAGLRTDGSQLLGVSPWPALSLDAPGSLRALAHFAILLGVALIGLRISTTETGRYRIMAAVAALCALAAATVGVHHLVGAEKLFGIYELQHGGPRLLGPLLNLNHLACLMALGAVIALALAAYARQHVVARVAWLGVVCLCGSVTVATVSRGGTLALAAGAFVVIAMLVAQKLSNKDAPRRGKGSSLTSTLPIAVIGACAVVLVIYSSAGDVGRKFAATSLDETGQSKSKFSAWKSAVQLIEESPWVGVGRGGFEASFTRVHPPSGALTFSHAENEYLQAVIDWGIPGALLLGGAALWLAVVALRRWRDGPLTAAALGALVVVAVQSNVDFGVEMLGVAVPITAIAATITYVPIREVSARALAISRIFKLAHLGLLVACIALLLSSATTSIDEDHTRIAARDVGISEIRQAIQRHPLDYYSYARAAEWLTRRGDRRAVPVLNHAMRLHPTHPGLHRIAGRLLHHDGYIEQATHEFAAAVRYTEEPAKLIAEVVALFPVKLAVAAIPADSTELDLVVRILDDLARPDVVAAWLDRVLQRKPNHGYACQLLYDRVLRLGDLRAVELAARRCRGVPPDSQTRLELARLMLREKKYDGTLQLLRDVEQWSGRVDDKTTGWLALCDAYTGLGNLDEAKRCLRRLDAAGVVTPVRAPEITTRLDEIAKQVIDAAPGDAGPSDGPTRDAGVEDGVAASADAGR